MAGAEKRAAPAGARESLLGNSELEPGAHRLAVATRDVQQRIVGRVVRDGVRREVDIPRHRGMTAVVPAAPGAALERLLGAPVTGLCRLSAGASRETWSFDAGGRGLILRRDPPEVPGPEGMAREAAGFRAAARAGVPIPELLAAGDGFLREELAPSDPRTGYLARVAADALTVARRELRLGPAQRAEHRALLHAPGCVDDGELAARIRDGALPADGPDVVAAVRASVTAQVAVADPRYLAPPPTT
ncbi:DUF6285 domain-containing protein [Pseudonocardia sp. RS010]|uniref:DUF6285 domain-containing protein n=1 Tax=Pseudonocardia sp. RS010 TaxID=3385979 RepID=UPI0039A2E335